MILNSIAPLLWPPKDQKKLVNKFTRDILNHRPQITCIAIKGKYLMLMKLKFWMERLERLESHGKMLSAICICDKFFIFLYALSAFSSVIKLLNLHPTDFRNQNSP